ncbi:predicted protein, partial [Micromonas commoda]
PQVSALPQTSNNGSPCDQPGLRRSSRCPAPLVRVHAPLRPRRGHHSDDQRQGWHGHRQALRRGHRRLPRGPRLPLRHVRQGQVRGRPQVLPRHLGIRVPAPVHLRPVRVPPQRQGPHRYAPHGHALPLALLLRRVRRPRVCANQALQVQVQGRQEVRLRQDSLHRDQEVHQDQEDQVRSPRGRVPKTKGLARRAVQGCSAKINLRHFFSLRIY